MFISRLRLMILVCLAALAFSPPLLAYDTGTGPLLAPFAVELPSAVMPSLLPAVENADAWPITSDNATDDQAATAARLPVYRFVEVPASRVDIVARFDRRYIRGFKASARWLTPPPV